MHGRTLHRRLAACGTNFRSLVDECRYAIARQMVEDTDSEVAQVADLLDYADTSAFARAFRRWSGTTPAQWRKRGQVALPVKRARPHRARPSELSGTVSGVAPLA